MKINILPKRRLFKSVAWLVLLTLFLNPLTLDLPQVYPLNRLVASSVAQAAVADRDGLGTESFWSFCTGDLGAGWGFLVNTFTGNLIIKHSLGGIPGRGIALSEGLVYNSLSSQSGTLGQGFKLANDQFIQENADQSVTFKDGDATNHRFTKNADGTYKAPDGIYLTLTKVSSTVFTIKDKANSVFRFENGLLKSITDEKDNITTFSYDAGNNPTTMTDPSGRSLGYAYDANGRLSYIIDSALRNTSFAYNAQGRLQSVTDPKGQTTTFGYDAQGRISTFTDANNRITTFYYDANGKLTKIDDARSNQSKRYSIQFSYDTYLLKTTLTDPLGKNVFFFHNSAGNLTKRQDAEGVSVTFDWDKNNLVKVTDANGSTSLSYENGNITSIADTLNASQSAVYNIQYDSQNKPTTLTAPNGNQVAATYDQKSNLLSASDTDRKEADANTYDSYGNTTSKTQVDAPTYNLLLNGSFERLGLLGTSAFNWTKGGNTSDVSFTSLTSFYGDVSAKISSASQTNAYLYSDKVSVTPGQKLTLRADAKISNVTGTTGALIRIMYFDSSDGFISESLSNHYRGTAGQTLISVTSEAPQGVAYAIVVLQMLDAKGTVWFDGVQLESPIKADDGHILTDFNYVENSSFEQDWSQWNSGGVSGAVFVSNSSPWTGTKSAKINLSSSGTAWARTAVIEVEAGELYTLSGLVKTEGVAGTGAHVQIQYYNALATAFAYETTAFQTGTKDYTRYAIAVTPPSGTAYARVYLAITSGTGIAYFDNIKLVPRATSSFSYDSKGNNLTSATDPFGGTASFQYDTAGNLTGVTDPKSNHTSYAYDSLGNLISVTDALSQVFRFGYDPVSMQITYRDARSSSPEDNTYKTSFAYNELNQLTSATDPLGRSITNTYDDAANLSSVAFPNGKRINYSYDLANRLKQVSYSGEPTSYTLSYDGAGNLSGVQDNQSRNYQFSYDKANRITSSTDIFGYQLNYTLDLLDNVTSVVDSNNKTVNYAYGSGGQLLSLTDPSGRQTKFSYDDKGRPFRIVRGNGVKAVYSYDEAGKIKQIGDSGNPDNAILFYSYDVNGNIVEIAAANGTHSYTYDALNRLTGWTDALGTVTSYEYDPVGNLTRKGSQTFTYNAANEITNSGFSYDSNGNLTSDGNLNYQYNTANQLTKVAKVSDGSTVATYEYDFRGLRTSKTTSSGTTRYHWANGRLTRESDASGNTIALYIYSGSGAPIAIEKGGQIYYTHVNHRGDILSVTDAAGNKVATYSYGPWGELLNQTGSFSQPFRYAGYYYDEETGLYYLKNRHYSPALGRFLTKDSFKGVNSNPKSLNLYAYCEGNPVKYVDPSGHVPVVLGAIGNAILSGGIAWAKYKYEVNTGQREYDLTTFLINTGSAAGFGFLNGLTFGLMGGSRYVQGYNLLKSLLVNGAIGEATKTINGKKAKSIDSEGSSTNSVFSPTSPSLPQTVALSPGRYVVGDFVYDVTAPNNIFVDGKEMDVGTSADIYNWLSGVA